MFLVTWYLHSRKNEGENDLIFFFKKELLNIRCYSNECLYNFYFGFL